ncbi:30S ribosomal protein S5 [Candidatus Peregrinibacteria bacterium CG10_big_fil_rev_8_21_14_0_10_36_19]|nr:MAG: 30S ribosomal protein S5 [Candidatus Peregrinibacteria bacterium CG10_big_fil_rev_8_21_14_0_10_36_19]
MSKPAHSKGGFKKEVKEFDEQVIQIDRVTKVVKGGRRLRFRATVAIGNKKGKVGIGIGKSHEVTGAIQKGIAKAKKDMATVILDGSTIPHDIKIKLKSSNIFLMPAAPGTGIIAGGTIRKVLELAGVKDILSKSYGTTNKVNNTKATFEALKRLRETPRMVAKAKKKNEVKATPAAPKKAEEAKAPKKPVAKKTTK